MKDCSEIIDKLQAEDKGLVREAALLAGEESCSSAIPHLAELLQNSNLGIQEAAELSLRKIGGSETIQAVIPLLRSEDVPVRNLAIDILRQVGNQDLDTLLDLLYDSDPDIRIFVADIIGSAGNVTAVRPLCDVLVNDPEVNVRYQAAVSLGELRNNEAVKCLNKAFSDDEWVQFAVIEALIKIRDESCLGALIKAIGQGSELIDSMIFEALGEMGNVKAIPLLLGKLDTAPAALRNKIVQAIVNLLGGKALTFLNSEEQDKFRRYLLEAIHDEDIDIQDAAMRGLKFVGSREASAAILNLVINLDSERDSERIDLAVDSLHSIGLTDSLEQTLRSEKEEEAEIAIQVLAGIDDPQARHLLMDVFWDKDRDLQREISNALSVAANSEGKEFFLKVLKEHSDGHVLKKALHFLGQVMQAREYAEDIFALLDHPYDDVKEAALEACIAIGNETFASRFRDMFSSSEPLHRLMAVYAFGKLGVENYKTELIDALADEVPDIRKVALEALGSEPERCDQIMPSFLPLLEDENREVRLTLVEILGKCSSEETVANILYFLDDQDAWVRVRAIEALAERRIEDAVHKIVPLLEDENKLLNLKAIEALGKIGGQSAFQALLGVLDRDDPELQSSAEQALSILESQ